jgi:hypothetical protein
VPATSLTRHVVHNCAAALLADTAGIDSPFLSICRDIKAALTSHSPAAASSSTHHDNWRTSNLHDRLLSSPIKRGVRASVHIKVCIKGKAHFGLKRSQRAHSASHCILLIWHYQRLLCWSSLQQSRVNAHRQNVRTPAVMQQNYAHEQQVPTPAMRVALQSKVVWVTDAVAVGVR